MNKVHSPSSTNHQTVDNINTKPSKENSIINQATMASASAASSATANAATSDAGAMHSSSSATIIANNNKNDNNNMIIENDDNNPNRPKRICVVGNVDAGKSTLVACLSKHILDDGRGLARSKVLRHRHEQEGGKSSAVAQEIVGYDDSDKQIIPSDQHSTHSQLVHSKIWAEVAEKSRFTLTLVDLCGHERYLKTTVFGLVGFSPDAAMLVVGSNAGFQKMAREHLQLMLALKIPFFVVFTKVDSMTPKNVALETLSTVEKVLRNVQKRPYRVRGEKLLDQAVLGLWSGRIVPMFSVSCVTGDGLELLRTFLGRLSHHDKASKANQSQLNAQDSSNDSNQQDQSISTSTTATDDKAKGENKASASASSDSVDTDEIITNIDVKANNNNAAKKEGLVEFVIDSNFLVPGVGVVAGGRMITGTIRTGDRALLGPDKTGAFRPIVIRSIHVNCRLVDFVSAGIPATFAIRSAPAAGREKSIAKSFPFTTINPIRDPLVSSSYFKRILVDEYEIIFYYLLFICHVLLLNTNITIGCNKLGSRASCQGYGNYCW